MLKQRGMRTAGRKSELVQRLSRGASSSSTSGGGIGASASGVTAHHHHHNHGHEPVSWHQEEGILAMVDGGMRRPDGDLTGVLSSTPPPTSTTSNIGSTSPPPPPPPSEVVLGGGEGGVSSQLFMSDPEIVAAKIVSSLRNGAKTIVI